MGVPFFIIAVQESFTGSYQAIVHLFYYFSLEILHSSHFLLFYFRYISQVGVFLSKQGTYL